MSRLRLATRGSELALVQCRAAARRIEAALSVETEIVPIRSTGDRITDRPLAAIGGKGLFVKELEEALADGRAEVAVHSAKDLPGKTTPGMRLVAYPERADPRDALVPRETGGRFHGLHEGARIGTGSVRRASQLRAARPDLEVVGLRGNVHTRLRKREEQGLDAVILACAGLDRLGIEGLDAERLDPELLLPAVGQGTIALEVSERAPFGDDLLAVDDRETRIRTDAERAFLAGLEGDCNTPIAALAELGPDGGLWLRGAVASTDGSEVVRGQATGDAADAEDAGARLAAELLERGGAVLLEQLRHEREAEG